MVGLGNPGSDYATSRHNVGFMVVDRLVERWGESPRSFQGKFGSVLMQSVHRGQRVHLQKPMEYMNLSGSALQRAMAFFRVEPARIVVIHDEIDLPYGRVRVKVGGGHGGHNGLRDTIAAIGESFWRLRLGVGHPGHRDEVVNYVLRRAPSEEDALLQEAVVKAADIMPVILRDGAQKAMNRLHS